MAVIVEALSVFVPVDSIELRYPGGLEGYESDAPNSTYCCDSRLTRVGFMSPNDVEHFTDRLRTGGIVLRPNPNSDVAIVDQLCGPTFPWPWIALHEFEPGVRGAYILGEDRGELAVPTGWSPAQLHDLADNWHPGEAVGKTMHTIGREEGLTTYFDEASGKLTFRGNAFDFLDP